MNGSELVNISIKPMEMELNPNGDTMILSEEKPKRKRKSTKKKEDGDKKEIVVSPVEIVDPENTSYLESNLPYHKSYDETDNILRSSIAQLDNIAAQVNEDLNTLRASKTIRNKYSYISDMTGSIVSAISAKVGAARELNNSIKNAHELDLKRMKELKLNENEADDEKSIMDVYKAFISQPVSTNMPAFGSPLGANTYDLTVGSAPGSNLGMNVNMLGQNPDIAYNNFVNNMTPEQMTMMIEENPSMKHVVTYDRTTGDANFAIYDSNTGRFIDGVPQRNKDMIASMTFDFNNMTAHSDNLNETYDVIYTDTPIVGAEQVPMQGEDMSQY